MTANIGYVNNAACVVACQAIELNTVQLRLSVTMNCKKRS